MRSDRLGTPRQCLDARQQFLEREGLRHIVVGASAERRDLRVNGVLRREHEHWFLESLRAQTVEDLEAGLFWQTHVEDHEVVRFRARPTLPFVAVGDEIDSVALLLETALHVLTHRRVVFDYQNPHVRAALDVRA